MNPVVSLNHPPSQDTISEWIALMLGTVENLKKLQDCVKSAIATVCTGWLKYSTSKNIEINVVHFNEMTKDLICTISQIHKFKPPSPITEQR